MMPANYFPCRRERVAVLVALLAVAILCSAGQVSAQEGASSEKGEEGRTDLAIKFFKAANLSGVGNATIFAPTDKAFRDLAKLLNISTSGGNYSDAFLRPPLLSTSLAVLKLHVIPGQALKSSDIPCSKNTTLSTLGNSNLNVYCEKKNIYVKGPGNKEGAEVVKADIPFNGSIVHVINKVVLP